MSFKKTGTFALATPMALAAGAAAAHGGHGAPPLHLHDAETLGLAALVALAAASVGATLWLWFSGRD